MFGLVYVYVVVKGGLGVIECCFGAGVDLNVFVAKSDGLWR